MELSDALYRVWSAYSSGWGLVVSIGMYAWLCLCLAAIARKSRISGWWAAWLPVLNLWLMCVAGKMTGRFTLLFLGIMGAIVIGIVAWLPLWLAVWLVLWGVCWVAVWARIAHERGRPPALGLLILVPVLNLVLLGTLAFGD